MKICLAVLALVAASVSGGALAENTYLSTGRASHDANGAVIVDMPPEVWNQGRGGNQQPCPRCCVYENRNYTEGAVLKAEGVLLQCARDEKSLGTHNLIWRMVR